MTPICSWCGAAKHNEHGLCSKCGRFPPLRSLPTTTTSEQCNAPQTSSQGYLGPETPPTASDVTSRPRILLISVCVGAVLFTLLSCSTYLAYVLQAGYISTRPGVHSPIPHSSFAPGYRRTPR